MFSKPTYESGLLNKSSSFRCDQIYKCKRGWFVEKCSRLSAAVGVTKFITIIAIFWVTVYDLDVQQTHLWSHFQAYMFNKPTTVC
jgi:hypothetical protein